MNLDHIRNDKYVLCNTLHDDRLKNSQRRPLVEIDRKNEYFAPDYSGDPDYSFTSLSGENCKLTLTTENDMKFDEWYLYPAAFELVLVHF